jgi:hypothetical protein
VVLVKFPSVPLALIWLLPNEMRDPAVGNTPGPLAPIVDAPALTTVPGELVWIPASLIGDDARLLDREKDLACYRM